MPNLSGGKTRKKRQQYSTTPDSLRQLKEIEKKKKKKRTGARPAILSLQVATHSEVITVWFDITEHKEKKIIFNHSCHSSPKVPGFLQ